MWERLCWWIKFSKQSLCTINFTMPLYSNHLIVIPLFRASNATVESSWRFICASNLNLHEVSFVEIALRTSGRSSIHVLPGIFTSQNIVRLLSLNFSVRSICGLQGVKIWATGAAKSHSIHIFFKKQQVTTHWTEMHFLRWLHSPLKRKIETTKISTVPVPYFWIIECPNRSTNEKGELLFHSEDRPVNERSPLFCLGCDVLLASWHCTYLHNNNAR